MKNVINRHQVHFLLVVYFSCICYNLYVDMRIAGIIFRIDAEKIKGGLACLRKIK